MTILDMLSVTLWQRSPWTLDYGYSFCKRLDTPIAGEFCFVLL